MHENYLSRLPQSLSLDDKLSLLLGKLARSHATLNREFTELWLLLVGDSPSRALVPDGVSPLVDDCVVMLSAPQMSDPHRQAALRAVRYVRTANKQRNDLLHQEWVLSETDGAWKRLKIAKRDKRHAPTPSNLAEVVEAICANLRASIRITVLNLEFMMAGWELIGDDELPIELA